MIQNLRLNGLRSYDRKIVRLDQRVGITIYPQAQDAVFPGRKTTPRKLNWKRDETEGSVVGFNWSKRLGDPVGKWQAEVKLGRQSTIDIMKGDVLGGDWVDISVLRNGVEFPLCRGRVVNIRQDDRSEGGATVRTLFLSGTDHGGLFKTIVSWNNIYIRTFKEIAFNLFTFKLRGAPGGTPGDLFETLIEGVFGNRTSSPTQSAWTLPPELPDDTFLDALTIIKGDTRGLYYNENQLWNNPGETMDSVLQRWCNPLLNEWIIDLEVGLNNEPVMTAEIKERPFISTIYGAGSPWFKLDELELPDWIAQSKSLGRSDLERFNIFQITSDMSYMSQVEQVAMAAPIYSLKEVEHHGIRPRTESTQFIAPGQSGEWVTERETWQRLMADWNCLNPYWLNGPVTAKLLLPEARIGTRFRLRRDTPDKDLTAYIEGIDMTFRWAPSSNAGPDGSTTLHLTRGWEGTDLDRFKAVTDAAASYVERF